MKFIPSRGIGVSVGAFLLLLLLGTSAFAVYSFASSAISPLTPLWVFVPLFGLPMAAFVGYRMYGLLTAEYYLDREGFSLTWGLASEQIPLAAISNVLPAGDLLGGAVLRRAMAWPGILIGEREIEGVGTVNFFATNAGDELLLLTTGDMHFAISPPNAKAFLKAFGQMTQMGSLRRIERKSSRPDFLSTRLWTDRLARWLIFGGIALPMTQLIYLALRASSLPAEVPFGFDPAGLPDPLAPPGRLLLLPLIGGVCWLIDLALGAWVYGNQRDRTLSYALWGSAILVGCLLWGAALHLLAAA